MSELPVGWTTGSVGELFEIVGGGTPPAADASNFSDAGSAHAWLTPADLSGYKKKMITHGARDLSPKGLKSSSAKLMPAGSVLFTSRAPIGYVAIADGEISTNQGFKSFVLPEGLDASYVYYYLKSIRELAESRGTGTTFKELSGAATKELPMVVAPFGEQKRIAQKLDSLLAQVDTLKARIDAIPALLKRFRQSVLAAAASGRLTEIWRVENKEGVGDADLQIAKISQHRAVLKKSSKASVDPLSHEMFEIPTSWRWVSLDLLSSKIVDGTHHTPSYTEHGVPFVSVKNIRHGRIDLAGAKRITKEEHAELCKRCRPEKGDLLITKSGTIGRTAVVESDDEFSLFVSVALVKPASTLVNIPFVDLALRKWVGEIDVASRIVGTAIKNLHLVDMRVLAVPFPPLEEQTEIVRRVEQLFAFADQLEAKVATAKQRIDTLTQSLLAKAFRGELVPQDPNDEPASVLLERIRAQRAAAPKPKRGRKTSA